MRTLYVGGWVHSVSLDTLEYVESGVICVNGLGIIEWAERDVQSADLQTVALRHGVELDGGVQVVELSQDEFLCPGFIDTHTHAPQYPNIGLGHGVPLLDWLQTLTFPEEQKYSDVEYARVVYGEVVRRTLNAGTTTSCYYGSLHLDATKALVDICLEKGQRAMVGKCSMDVNSHSYVESTSDAITSSAAFIEHFPHLLPTTKPAQATPYPTPPSSLVADPPRMLPSHPLVQPILTPRFALSTTPALLDHLSALSRAYSPPLAIQTHMSENHQEIAAVAQLFPEASSYADVYDRHGLLGDGTILAHCIHLTDGDRQLVAARGAGISHCPTSNLHINSGAARVREMLDEGIKVGLGTDCSGGYSLGILPVARLASHVSRQIAFAQQDYRPLAVEEVFYLATMGGAALCRLQDVTGNFVVGKEFDALRVKPASPGMWVKQGETVRARFEKWLWSGDDRDIRDVFVRGRRVGGITC